MTKELLLLRPIKAGASSPTLYATLARRLLERANLHGFVETAQVYYVLGSLYRVDKSKRLQVLKEMKKYGIVKKITPRGVWLA